MTDRLEAAGERPAMAQPAGRREPWFFYGMYGKSIEFLGSEDIREVWGFGAGYSRPERKLRYGAIRAELVLEGYYRRDRSPGIPGITYIPPTKTDNYGALAYGRWKWPSRSGMSFYLDIGWGLQFADEATYELPSRLSSTPMIGIGVAIDQGGTEWLVGFRLMHISNGGTRGNNPGQNQLQGYVGFRF